MYHSYLCGLSACVICILFRGYIVNYHLRHIVALWLLIDNFCGSDNIVSNFVYKFNCYCSCFLFHYSLLHFISLFFIFCFFTLGGTAVVDRQLAHAVPPLFVHDEYYNAFTNVTVILELSCLKHWISLTCVKFKHVIN